MRSITPILGSLLCAMVANNVLAADGAIEINEACVDTGCFEGDSGGYPVQISEPGKYILTSNLTVAGTTSAISASFTANDVTIDLNGFTVSGPVTCTGEPVTSCTSTSGGSGIQARQRTVVKNGNVQGFGGFGVAVDQDSLVHNVTISGNGLGGVDLFYSTIKDSSITKNGGDGVSATSGGGNARVINVLVRGNLASGINASRGQVLNSTLLDNGEFGLRSDSGGGNAAYGHNQFLGNGSGSVTGGVAIGCNSLDGLAVCP